MISNTKQESYCRMVTYLAKPGADILITLDTNKAHLIHMLLGLAGEGYELQEAFVEGSSITLKEELGDIHFYLQGIAQALDIDLFALPEMSPRPVFNGGIIENLSKSIGDVVDTGKKLVIYNQPERAEKLLVCINRLWYCLEHFRQYIGLSLEDVLDANMDKLLTGANARYKDGYSDAAAKERADKAGQEDDHA